MHIVFKSIHCCCCCSVAKLCLTLCNPMDWSTAGFPVFHYLPEFAQIHIHWVGYAIQPSHSLPSASPFASSLSLHQSLFQWVDSVSGGQSIEASTSASGFPMNIHGWFPLDWLVWSPWSPRDPRVWKHQFFGTQPSLWSNSHTCTWLLETHSFT